MLVLSRGKNEQINIGNDITVTILKFERGKVFLGIDAPKSIAVDRSEVRTMKKEQALRQSRKCGTMENC
jgi:carbon storage regulator